MASEFRVSLTMPVCVCMNMHIKTWVELLFKKPGLFFLSAGDPRSLYKLLILQSKERIPAQELLCDRWHQARIGACEIS